MTPPLVFSAEVQRARSENAPVVALESTIITHGMPYPLNVTTAAQVEDDIRAAGATPATIAVLDGKIRIGLSQGELADLAARKDVRKLSRGDLAFCVATGGTGATTVAATMICANLAGIDVFATGGIGGVHRGAADSFDISADLHELAKTPVTVVCAGAKAILDIPKTLEVLETLGVPVITYGQDEFPAFWARHSGSRSPLRLDECEPIARAHLMRAKLGGGGGQLIANPIAPEHEIALHEITPLIDQAIHEAHQNGIGQKEVTPALLSRIFELSEGRSLDANIALVRANARLGARIASALNRLKGERSTN